MAHGRLACSRRRIEQDSSQEEASNGSEGGGHSAFFVQQNASVGALPRPQLGQTHPTGAGSDLGMAFVLGYCVSACELQRPLVLRSQSKQR